MISFMNHIIRIIDTVYGLSVNELLYQKTRVSIVLESSSFMYNPSFVCFFPQ